MALSATNIKLDPADHAATLWRLMDATFAGDGCCAICGEPFEDSSANVEAFELCGELVCDTCAEEVFEDNSQFGVGA